MISITGHSTGKKYYINSTMISSLYVEAGEDGVEHTRVNLTADAVGFKVFDAVESVSEILSKIDLLTLIGLTNMDSLTDGGV